MMFEIDMSNMPKQESLRVFPQQLDIPEANALIGGAQFSKTVIFQSPLSSIVVAGMIGAMLAASPVPSGGIVAADFVVASGAENDLDLNDSAEIQLSEVDWDLLASRESETPTVNATLLSFLTKSKAPSQ